MAQFEKVAAPVGFPNLPPHWKSESFLFPSTVDGVQIYTSIHRATEKPKNALFICHGQGEHSGRYLHFPHYLEPNIDALVCIDHRGHGRSSGPRGHASEFDIYLDDWIGAYHESIKMIHPTYKHVFAHSMGALVLLRILKMKEAKFDSVILSAPLLDLGFKVPIWKSAPAKLLAKAVPRFALPTELDVREISRDPNVQKHYKEDKLNTGMASASWFVSLLETMAETRSWNHLPQLPLRLIIPLGERIVSPPTNETFAANLREPRIEILKLLEFKHESFNDIEKEKVFEKIKQWLTF